MNADPQEPRGRSSESAAASQEQPRGNAGQKQPRGNAGQKQPLANATGQMQPRGEAAGQSERYGPLGFRRIRKEDGRELIYYTDTRDLQ